MRQARSCCIWRETCGSSSAACSAEPRTPGTGPRSSTRAACRPKPSSHASRQFVQHVVGGLAVERLSAPFPGGFFDEPLSIQAVLLHLNGHLNYHLGQVDYMRRHVTGNGAIALAGLPAVVSAPPV